MPTTNDEKIFKISDLEFFDDNLIGDYHTSCNTDHKNNWWDAYCVGFRSTSVPRTIDEIISTACLKPFELMFRDITPDDPEEVEHRKTIRKVFESRSCNVIVCRSRCCQGTLPRMLFLSRSDEEMSRILENSEIIDHDPSPSFHFFYIIYPIKYQEFLQILEDAIIKDTSSPRKLYISNIVYSYYNSETIICAEPNELYRENGDKLLKIKPMIKPLPSWARRPDFVPLETGKISTTPYYVEKTLTSQYLCPTRILFYGETTGFVWNDDGKYIEGHFLLPRWGKLLEKASKTSSGDVTPGYSNTTLYLANIECSTEYPTDYIMIWRTVHEPIRHHFAHFDLKNMKVNVLEHCPPREEKNSYHSSEKNIFSWDKTIEIKQPLYEPCIFINHNNGTETIMDDYKIITEKSLGKNNDTDEKTIHIERVSILSPMTLRADISKPNANPVFLYLDFNDTYSVSGITDYNTLHQHSRVTYSSDNSSITPILEDTLLSHNRPSNVLKAFPKSCLPPHAAVKVHGRDVTCETMLYDGRLVIPRFSSETENWRDISITIWAPKEDGELFSTFIKNNNNFNGAIIPVQLPSTIDDVKICKETIGKFIDIPLSIVDMITSYLSLPSSVLNARPMPDFGHYIKLVKN